MEGFKEVIFIGGPWDGRVKLIGADTETFTVAVPNSKEHVYQIHDYPYHYGVVKRIGFAGSYSDAMKYLRAT